MPRSRILSRATECDPNFANARLNLGMIRQQQGRLAQALQDYQTATRLEPDQPLPYRLLAGVLVKQGGRRRGRRAAAPRRGTGRNGARPE